MCVFPLFFTTFSCIKAQLFFLHHVSFHLLIVSLLSHIRDLLGPALVHASVKAKTTLWYSKQHQHHRSIRAVRAVEVQPPAMTAWSSTQSPPRPREPEQQAVPAVWAVIGKREVVREDGYWQFLFSGGYFLDFCRTMFRLFCSLRK